MRGESRGQQADQDLASGLHDGSPCRFSA
jgi:hypothetical protein